MPTASPPTTTPPASPVPAPPGTPDGRELQEAVARLQRLDPADLDAVIAAAEDTHQHLRNRLGHAGGR